MNGRGYRTISIDLLREFFFYDANTGLLFNKLNNSRHFTTVSTHGYLCGKCLGHAYRAHRVAWAIYYGEWPNGEIDHINGVKDDNRISNLRVATRTENSRNMPRISRNKSGVTGVSWNKHDRRWIAKITDNNKYIYLGTFVNREDAVAARKAAEQELGYHPNHGRAA